MPDYLAELRCRLTELGCPSARLNRMVHEIADHRDDLMLGTEPDPAAAARADSALGNPRALADKLMASHRQATWCGRHFLVAFGLLPPLAFPLLWAACMVGELWLAFGLGFGWDEHKLRAAPVTMSPQAFHCLAMVVYAANDVAITLVALLFYWLARRSGVRLAWLLVPCLICSAYGMFVHVKVDRHQLFVGLYNVPHWSQAAMPLLLAAFACLRHRWRVHAARSLTTSPP